MNYITKTLDFKISEPSVITLGKFDGLHRGHELLMENLLKMGLEKGYKTIVFTFDIPPKKTVNQQDYAVITTNEEKRHIFEKTGVDYLIECPFTKEVMELEAEEFISWITDALSVKCIVVGDDFCFGHNRSGNVQVLKEFEQKYGYETIILEKVKDQGTGRDISSTFVREELTLGHMDKAKELLGYDFFLMSQVIHGNQIGRKMGIPTINMAFPEEKILPPFGVYVSRVWVKNNWYMGISNIGKKPTVGDNNPVGAETYILDFCQDLYEETMIVEFLKFVRPEQKFDSLDALQQQISSDIAFAQRYFHKA